MNKLLEWQQFEVASEFDDEFELGRRGQAGRNPAQRFAAILKREGFLPSTHFVERFLQRILSQGSRFDPRTFRREFLAAKHYRQTRPGYNTRFAVVRDIPIVYRPGGENGNRIVLVTVLTQGTKLPPVTPASAPRQREAEFQSELISEFEADAMLKSERFKNNARLQRTFNNSPVMRRGEQGEAVRILQQALIDAGFPMSISTQNGSKSPDGIYGNETVTTVQKFQLKYGLQSDGIVGRATLGKLDELFSSLPVPASPPPSPLPVQVTCNQQELKKLVDQCVDDSKRCIKWCGAKLAKDLLVCKGNPACNAAAVADFYLGVKQCNEGLVVCDQRAKQSTNC